jgi:hypothetical protein
VVCARRHSRISRWLIKVWVDRFLYQGREVSYTSILDRSVSARREALYKARGLDIEMWVDLVSDQRSLKREIKRISEDYDDREREREDEARRKEAKKAERENIKEEGKEEDS